MTCGLPLFYSRWIRSPHHHHGQVQDYIVFIFVILLEIEWAAVVTMEEAVEIPRKGENIQSLPEEALSSAGDACRKSIWILESFLLYVTILCIHKVSPF